MIARWLARDRVILLAALAGVTLLAWLYLVVAAQRMSSAGMVEMPSAAMSAGTMPGMPASAMPATTMAGMTMAEISRPAAWGAAGFALNFAMWWVMMLGMMLPSAAPMVLLYATIARRQQHGGQPFVATSLFVGGYLLAWGGFSLAASLLQWGLDQAAMLSAMVQTTSEAIAATIFLLAGIYQFTPLKAVCLHHCRSPFAFLLNQWRDGRGGALTMGWRHGLYCLGCCWVLMLVLFAVGAMNLLWVAILAGFVLAEKVLPGGVWVGRAAGALMLLFGLYLLVGAAGYVT